MPINEKRRECFFWLREYMRRGCFGLFADVTDGILSSTEILQKLQRGEPLPFSGQFLGSCPPAYLFKAVMPYMWHRNADDHIANKILNPIANPEHGEYSTCEPVVIDYSAGIERAIVELRALFDFYEAAKKDEDSPDEWDKAALALVAEEYGKGVIKNAVPRATGLWLWDYLAEKRGKESSEIPRGAVSNAIREFEGAGFDLMALEIEKAEVSDFRFYLRKTRDCIASGRVLPFTKIKREPKIE